MTRNTFAAMVTKDPKNSSVKKDAICLALVIAAVFILHAFSKNTADQLYKAKKDNAAANPPTWRVSYF